MQVETNVEVTKKQFYDYLCNQFINDIKNIKKVDVTDKDFERGYSYERFLTYKKQRLPIQFTIGPCIKDAYFEVSYKTPKAKIKYFYDLRNGENNTTLVRYFEESEVEESLGAGVHKFLSSFKKKSVEIKAINNIIQMEQTIKKQNGIKNKLFGL